ncbi:MAG TPA: hypothetical protein ENK02_01690 [Planctomycetes bacterium]|nr:hypothetical protein [Planctomycetota bacterium]
MRVLPRRNARLRERWPPCRSNPALHPSRRLPRPPPLPACRRWGRIRLPRTPRPSSPRPPPHWRRPPTGAPLDRPRSRTLPRGSGRTRSPA